MTKLKKVLLGFIGACLLVAVPFAHAQNAPETNALSGQEHPGQRVQEIFNQLNLTDDQKKQLEANKQQHRARMESARQEIKTDKAELREELMKPQLDMPRINEIHGRIKGLLSQMEDDKLSSILGVRTILTPEQFLKFVGMMHKHKQEREEN